MNQILDHSGPQKLKKQRNPAETMKITRIYAIIIMVIAICFIGKGVYSLVSNNTAQKEIITEEQNKDVIIKLYADKDIVNINVSHYSNIEEISYQWYKGVATLDEIHQLLEEQETQNNTDNNEADDEEGTNETQKVYPLMDSVVEKGKGTNTLNLQNIGIPKGETTIYITVKVAGNNEVTEFVQNYYTDVGVDRIAPKLNVSLKGKKLIISATDETQIAYIAYSINDGNEEKVTDTGLGNKINAEIDLDETNDTKVKITAVDQADNSQIYEKTYAVYISKPSIQFIAEPDYSKINVTASYNKGIKKVEYVLNGETYAKEFDELVYDVKFEVQTVPGHNEITVRAYTDEEQVYAEETGECTYNPQ